MAVKKKYDRNVLGRGLDNIGTGKGRGLDALIDTRGKRKELLLNGWMGGFEWLKECFGELGDMVL